MIQGASRLRIRPSARHPNRVSHGIPLLLPPGLVHRMTRERFTDLTKTGEKASYLGEFPVAKEL